MRTKNFNGVYGRPTVPELQDIEYNLGNLCNMKCRMCTSMYSSRWIQDDERFDRKVHHLVRRKAADLDLDLSKLVNIKFIGGEPTLEQDEVRALLLGVLQARGTLGDLHVEFATNGLLAFDDDIIDLLLQCKLVNMVVSIDGMEISNDYQRTGSVWSKIMATMDLYHSKQSDHWHLGVLTTFSIFTIHECSALSDLIATRWPDTWHLANAIDYPVELAPRNLPQAYKDAMLMRLRAWIPSRTTISTPLVLSQFISALEEPNDIDIERVRSYVTLLDELRSEDLSSIMPDLHAALFA